MTFVLINLSHDGISFAYTGGGRTFAARNQLGFGLGLTLRLRSIILVTRKHESELSCGMESDATQRTAPLREQADYSFR
jgi:hypothetical protein